MSALLLRNHQSYNVPWVIMMYVECTRILVLGFQISGLTPSHTIVLQTSKFPFETHVDGHTFEVRMLFDEFIYVLQLFLMRACFA